MLTLSNKHIEDNLKGANMWYHANNYFQGMIQQISPTLGTAVSLGKTNFMAVVNVTENEIIIIPIDTTNRNTLETDKSIYLCYEDIDFVESTRYSATSNIQVTTKKNNEVVFKMVVNAFLPAEQSNNFMEFVKTFKNNGVPSITNVYGTANSQINTASTITDQTAQDMQRTGTVFVCIFAFFMLLFINSIILVTSGANDDFTFMIPIGMFDVFFVIALISAAAKAFSSSKPAPLYNEKSKAPTESTKDSDFTTSENIIGSDSPIMTEDEDYGGIKKL